MASYGKLLLVLSISTVSLARSSTRETTEQPVGWAGTMLGEWITMDRQSLREGENREGYADNIGRVIRGCWTTSLQSTVIRSIFLEIWHSFIVRELLFSIYRSSLAREES